jgi:hypothetical protein
VSGGLDIETYLDTDLEVSGHSEHHELAGGMLHAIVP